MLQNQFRELSKDPIMVEELAKRCDVVDFKVGDVLLKEGGYAKFIPLVLTGLIKVYKEGGNGGEVLLYYIDKGESCIMSATYCLQNQKSEVKAVVEQPATVILVPADVALEFRRTHRVWNEFLLSLFSDKYNELLHIVQMLTFENMDKRLLEYLQNEKKIKNSNIIHVTHQKIAGDIGATREVVSRLLKKLENEGHLKLEFKKIILD